MKYRKKPIEIEAIKFKGFKNGQPLFSEMTWWLNLELGSRIGITRTCNRYRLTISTLEGCMTVSDGDYIIRGVNGELYPCKPSIFKKTYEEI